MERLAGVGTHMAPSSSLRTGGRGATRRPHLTWTIALCTLLLSSSVSTLNLRQCSTALGLQSGDIADADITASSFSEEKLGPASARIRTEIGGGAWCPKGRISKESHEFLEIDLKRLKVITTVETQGRFRNGQGEDFADQYMLEFQREDGGPWIHFRNRRNIRIFQGNRNAYIAEPQSVDPPIIARRIRFVPYSVTLRTVCMRVELHGCDWTDGVVSYDVQQGDRRSIDVDFHDATYDGDVTARRLTGGLGQLTDGHEGQKRLRHDGRAGGVGTRARGYEWVGWRNETIARRPLTLVFRFDTVRNFTKVRLHSSNAFHKDVRVFRAATVRFSIAGHRYDNQPAVSFNYTRDELFDSARFAIVSLKHRIGRFVKLELHFDSKWLMISEVQFQSEIAVGNFSDEPVAVVDFKKVFDGTHDNNTGVHASSSPPAVQHQSLDEQYLAIIIGTLVALLLLGLAAVILVVIARRRRHTTTSRDYAVPDLAKSALIVTLPHTEPLSSAASLLGGSPCRPPFAPPQRPPSDVHYAMSDVTVGLPGSIQGVSGGNVYATPTGGADAAAFGYPDNADVRELPRERLRFVEQLGEGQFGEVHLCEAIDMADLLDVDVSTGQAGDTIPVAVKTLRLNATEKARADFRKELCLLARLHDVNIVRVLGACMRSEPACVVVEYMRHGDLHNFLQHCELEGTVQARAANVRSLSYGCLVYMASQIASGMKHLEALNMVHRDLAARNCLVGDYFTIKISDFGMSRRLYSCDYYTIEGQAVLPIRWMSWESLLLGKFSTKSDVWSFGVTLWEVLSFARLQPFIELSDQQVIDNCTFCYEGDVCRQRQLAAPPGCPREIYDLMRECWNSDDARRPTFREVHMFLERKNMGYDPMGERDLLAPAGAGSVCV